MKKADNARKSSGSLVTAPTPGPWIVEDSRKLKSKRLRSNLLMVVAAKGGMPGLIVNQGSVTPTDEANARLIAAAPDLMAALEAVHFDISSCGVVRAPTQQAMRAAINKAKGIS